MTSGNGPSVLTATSARAIFEANSIPGMNWYTDGAPVVPAVTGYQTSAVSGRPRESSCSWITLRPTAYGPGSLGAATSVTASRVSVVAVCSVFSVDVVASEPPPLSLLEHAAPTTAIRITPSNIGVR